MHLITKPRLSFHYLKLLWVVRVTKTPCMQCKRSRHRMIYLRLVLPKITFFNGYKMNQDACSVWPFSFYHGLALHYEALVGKWLLKPTEPSHLGLMSAEFTLKTGTIILTIQRCPCKIQLEKRSIVYIVCTALPMSCDSRAVIDVELLQRCRQRRVIVDLEELAQEIWKWMEM